MAYYDKKTDRVEHAHAQDICAWLDAPRRSHWRIEVRGGQDNARFRPPESFFLLVSDSTEWSERESWSAGCGLGGGARLPTRTNGGAAETRCITQGWDLAFGFACCFRI